MNWRVKQPVTSNEQTCGLKLGASLLQYAAMRHSILTLGTGLAFGFVSTRSGLEGPDVPYFFMHASYADAAERKLDRLPGMTVGVTRLCPQSRGTIHAASPDPMRAHDSGPTFPPRKRTGRPWSKA